MGKRFPGLVLLLPLVVTILVATCGGDDPTATSPAQSISYSEVHLASFRFVPATLKVKAGQTARFRVISDHFPHTFTIRSLDVDVVLQPGARKTIEFEVPVGISGDLELVCRPHESVGMVGTLRVTRDNSSEVTSS